MTHDPDPLHALTALEARQRLETGALSVRDYALALLARVDEVEPAVQAWAHLERGHVLAQADALDRRRASGAPVGPLFGLPVGVKDIIDTADLPTENGCVLDAGRRPSRDAAVVQALRDAGALIMGKTVTTELATYSPGKTRHPQNPAHTPGGSSSGSAAAVAAAMVPLAVGTQTNGSVLRPASFCGVVGFKPSRGTVPARGVLVQSPSFDQIGVFGRSVDDVALLAQVLMAAGSAFAAAVSSTAAPRPPRLGFVRTPMWDRMDADAQAAFESLSTRLGSAIVEVELPSDGTMAVADHGSVMEAEIAASYDEPYFQRGADRLSASLQAQIARGRAVSVVDHHHALARLAGFAAGVDSLYERFDVLCTPATLGTAPLAAQGTGNPVMCTLWTATGQPALTLPLLQGANGLPLGVQLVGRCGDDASLLRHARWLVEHWAAASRA